MDPQRSHLNPGFKVVSQASSLAEDVLNSNRGRGGSRVTYPLPPRPLRFGPDMTKHACWATMAPVHIITFLP